MFLLLFESAARIVHLNKEIAEFRRVIKRNPMRKEELECDIAQV